MRALQQSSAALLAQMRGAGCVELLFRMSTAAEATASATATSRPALDALRQRLQQGATLQTSRMIHPCVELGKDASLEGGGNAVTTHRTPPLKQTTPPPLPAQAQTLETSW